VAIVPEREERDLTHPSSPDLTGSRYVPFVMKGSSLAVWFDSQEGQYAVFCPKCHRLIVYDTADIVYREMVWNDRRCCQGCRAGITFERNPGVIGIVLDFWYRTGDFPQSSSWLEAIPTDQFHLWTKEIRAALESEQSLQEGGEGKGDRVAAEVGCP
jgi:hypothetical protein